MNQIDREATTGRELAKPILMTGEPFLGKCWCPWAVNPGLQWNCLKRMLSYQIKTLHFLVWATMTIVGELSQRTERHFQLKFGLVLEATCF